MDLAETKSLSLLNKENMAKLDKKNTIKTVSYVLKRIERLYLPQMPCFITVITFNIGFGFASPNIKNENPQA